MSNTKSNKPVPKKKVVKGGKSINKEADVSEAEKHKASAKAAIELALDGRKKLSLQKRAGDTIVYVRMMPALWDVFEQAYAKHCIEYMLNPASYGMGTFVRERAFAQLKADRSC